MGAAVSGSAPGVVAPSPPACVAAIPAQYLQTQPEGKTVMLKRSSMLKSYVEVCSAFTSVASGSSFHDEATFKEECLKQAGLLHKHYVKQGKAQSVVNGIYYHMLPPTEAKVFQGHIKAVEAISFLDLPFVKIPRCGMMHFMGLAIACITVRPLHAIVPLAPAPPRGQAPISAPNAGEEHVLLVRKMIAKALRLHDEPCVVMYYGGDGFLVIVDASHLLSPLCAMPTNGKYWHLVRPEGVLCRDAPWDLSVSGSQTGPKNLADPQNDCQKSIFSLLTDAAVGGKKGVPTLSALSALSVSGVSVHGDTLKVVRTASLSTHSSGWETRFPTGFRGNLSLTSHMYFSVLPQVASVVDTLREDLGQADFCTWLHSQGIGMHMLGSLWHLVHRQGHGRKRIAVEMVARAGNKWLSAVLAQANSVENLEAILVGLFRDINNPDWLRESLFPTLFNMFGPLDPLPLNADLPFKVLFDRLRDLTGAYIQNGKLQHMSARVKVARSTFALTSSEASVLIEAAQRRRDGSASSAVIHSACRWSHDIKRYNGFVDSITAWSHQAQQQQRPEAREVHFLLCCYRVALTTLYLEKGDKKVCADLLKEALPQLLTHISNTPHGRLFYTQLVLRLGDHQSSLQRAKQALELTTQVLQLRTLSTPPAMNYNACRLLLETQMRVLVEAFHANYQHQEALQIADSWVKKCPQYFGEHSRNQCRAVKLLFVSYHKCKMKTEAQRLSKEFVHLCLEVYGDKDARTASALNEQASLLWRRSPNHGLQIYQRALEVFRASGSSMSRGICTTLHNMGLTYIRLNRFRSALQSFARALEIATSLNEVSTMRSCVEQEGIVRGVAAMKIQRWYREFLYQVPKSQTTKTDITVTKCSTLSWSDDHDEIESNTADF